THIHSATVMLYRGIQEFLDFGEGHDLVKFLSNFALRHPKDGAIEEDILAPGQLRVKASADLQEARDPPAQQNAPLGRLCDAAEDLEQSALAGPVAPDDADDLGLFNVEAHVLERPKFLHLVALNDLPAASEIERLTSKVAHLAGDNIAQRHVLLAL